MSAPLVVNTRDGVCWTRRTVTSGGIALYAPERVKTCPEFVMATIDELAEHGIVGSADALPVPVSPEPQAEERAKVAALIGDAKPATDQLLLEMAQQIRDRREHDHSTAADWDWYCLNASGWLGDKAPTVLRRLLDTEARVAELEAERHSTNESLDDAVQALRTRETSPLTVFRASHDSIVMGLYTTAAEARKHCETEMRREYDETTKVSLWWREDEDTVDQPEDGEQALFVHATPAGMERGRTWRPGYVVTPLEIASAYDPDGDE